MPIINTAATILNHKFSGNALPTTATDAEAFAPGKPLDAAFVFPQNRRLMKLFQAYLDALPSGMKEALRAVIYDALTARPPIPVIFMWEAAYDFELKITQTPDTRETRGMIGVTLRGRYPGDRHPLAAEIVAANQASRKGASRASPKPAKRKPAKSSSKSEGRA